MSKKSNIKRKVLFALSVSLIVAAATAFILTIHYRQVCFQVLGRFCEGIVQKDPNSRQIVLELLKTQDYDTIDANENILLSFGYRPSNLEIMDSTVIQIAAFGFLIGVVLFLFSFWYWHKKSVSRIKVLTSYLEKINTGGQGLLLDTSEDEFSRLQDEMYKTVTTLYQTRDAALTARNNFAENLSNIAHQLKTPITSISLFVQMEKEHLGDAYVMEIKRQLDRLTHLEEALLLLSRIDAGTLELDKKPADVFTMLTLASDNLYELFMQAGVWLDVPEMGEMFCIEAFVIAGKPLFITLPLTVLFVQFAVTASYLDPMVFWLEAPIVPILIFAAAIVLFVAFAYYIGGKRLLQCDLNETLHNDTLV